MIVHLIDGTYELFRHFYGLRRFRKDDPPLGAVLGVVRTVVQMFESDATHLGVATDHVIESFRNELWPGYKTGDGIEPALLAQFHPLEEALVAMGVAVWPMVELEADDALASAAHLAADDARVQKVCIWTPDKDLAQCVRGDRVVQVDRRGNRIRNAAGVVEKFGVAPELIPDYLALVGDAADGYPGIPGIGAATAARLLNRHGGIENLPDGALGGTHGRASSGASSGASPGATGGARGSVAGEPRELALLFRELARLRIDAQLFDDVDSLHWRGPTGAFDAWAARLGDDKLLERVRRAASAHGSPS